ncbi:MAG: hypothetical protein ACOX2I_04180 [Candidatus Ozemobacteraceae bacterium]|jgi:hypothetical protein
MIAEGLDAPAVPGALPAWDNYLTGTTLGAIDSSVAKTYVVPVKGLVPFYQYYPLNGDLINANLWVVKINLTGVATAAAQVSIDGGSNWTAISTGNKNFVPGANSGEYYVIGAGTTDLTIKVDNDGDTDNTTYDRITMTFDVAAENSSGI